MTIENALQEFLTSSPDLLPVGSRIYSHKAPQNAVEPYIVLYRVAVTPRHTHRGHIGSIERLMQFSVFSRSQSMALGIADSLRQILDGYSGTMGDYSIGAVLWNNERHGENETTGMHQLACDFSLIYKEP